MIDSSKLIVLFVVLSCTLSPTGANAQRVDSTFCNVIIERHDNLVCYYPQFSSIDLMTGTMPSKSDNDVIFVCAAAFTGKCLDEFAHSNIAGHHVCSGTFYEGYSCGVNDGAFTWSESDGWHFHKCGYNSSVNPLQVASAQGGCGFCQDLIFLEGQELKVGFEPDAWNQWRALCDIDGKLCIVDCAEDMTYVDFKAGMKRIGVRTALYCDMGSGWNYSWYRKDDGSVKEIFPVPGAYTTNWITFYKRNNPINLCNYSFYKK